MSALDRFLADHDLTRAELPSRVTLGWEHAMTDWWTCTDCGAAIPDVEIHEHMRDVHGVQYVGVYEACPDCTETEPCGRVRLLAGD